MDTNLRQQFPILQQQIHGKPLIYFDNAATTQKPHCVIEAMVNYYSKDNANIRRGVHVLSQRATAAYEGARLKVQNFINAKSEQEIIFVRNATEAINLVAQSYGRQNLQPNDEVIISAMEHHSNLVPWQMVCQEKGALLRVINITEAGEIDLNHYASLLNEQTKIVAITHVSNTLGTINPIKKMITMAHAENIPVLIDGAQAAAHLPVDVQDLDCDFYAFSGHKMYGPTGIGVLYGKLQFLEKMPPYQGGGNMIKKVTFEATEYGELPHRFEAGTPNIAGVIGLGAAVDFINAIGRDKIYKHELQLLKHTNLILQKVPGIKIIGNASQKIGVISLVFAKAHPHDVATILDMEGIAIRGGHHCNMPLMDLYKISGTARISLGIYNTEEELDALIPAIQKVQQFFG